MAYTQYGNFLDFFRPVMAVAGNATKPLCAIDIGASSADHGEWVCIRPCTVQKLIFNVTLEAAGGSSVAPQVVFTKRSAYGVSSGEAVIGTLTIPDGTAVGKTVIKNITPVKFEVGQSLEVSHVIGTGSPTGMGDADIEASYSPENTGNNSNIVVSA